MTDTTNKNEISNKNYQAEIQQRKDTQRQLQQAQKLEAIGTFAHDFNNVLTIIHTCSQLVMDDISQNQSAYGNMEKILKACEKAKELVNQLLTFTRKHHRTTFDGSFPKINKSKTDQSKPQTSVSKGNEHVLLIDDEGDLLNTVQLLLEHIGYQVTAFRNPLDALCEFEKNSEKFDIAIVDLQMPEMNGKQLTRKIKEIRKDLPLMITSGNSAEISDNEMDQLGVNDFLLKPFLKKDLSESIKRILSAQS
jgi:CheY-like chemotaxis protein